MRKFLTIILLSTNILLILLASTFLTGKTVVDQSYATPAWCCGIPGWPNNSCDPPSSPGTGCGGPDAYWSYVNNSSWCWCATISNDCPEDPNNSIEIMCGPYQYDGNINYTCPSGQQIYDSPITFQDDMYNRCAPACTNTCSGAYGPTINVNSPSSSGYYLVGNVSFAWNNIDWGSCGGDTCNGTCQDNNGNSLTYTLVDPNGVTRVSQNYNVNNNQNFSQYVDMSGTWTWSLNMNGSCRDRVRNYSFTVDDPPTVLPPIITNTDLCNADPLSDNWTGIHPSRISSGGSAGINNPIYIQSDYSDANGVGDLRYLRMQVFDPDASYNATGTLQYSGGNFALRTSSGTTSFNYSTDAICDYGNGTQTICQPSVLPASATSYMRINSINQLNTSTFRIVWEAGLLSPTLFDGTIEAQAYAEDRFTANSGWQTGNNNWKADLYYPTTSVTNNITGPNAFSTNFATSDNSGIIINQEKLCSSGNINQPFNLSDSGNTYTFSTSNQTYNPCFNSNTGIFDYTVTPALTEGSLSMGMNATDIACNKSPNTTATISLARPWLITTNGDFYTRNGISQYSLANIPQIVNTNLSPFALNGTNPRLSGYDFMQQIPQLPAKSSAKSYNLIDYNDFNGKPLSSTGYNNWYDYLSDLLAKNDLTKNLILVLTGNQSYQNAQTSTISNLADLNIVRVNGNLTINNMICDTKTIFLVSQDLRIEPDFKINDDPLTGEQFIKGCMFIVKGRTTIGSGTTKSSGSQAAYDEIEAMIVTTSFTSEYDSANNGLIIDGSLITINNNQFLRDVGVIWGQVSPSEVFVFDGARYLFLFGDYLSSPTKFSIREKQFINSLK